MGSVRVISTRLLCASNAKSAVAGSRKTLARAVWSVCLRRGVCSSPWRLQGCMSAWVIDQYGSNEVLKFSEEIPSPTVSSPNEVMVKVHATSLNPLDIAMRGKWNRKYISIYKNLILIYACALPGFRWLRC